MDDLLSSPDDTLEVEPKELEGEFFGALRFSLAKTLASDHEKPWTDMQESKLQECIAALVASAKRLGIKTIRLICTRPTGESTTQELDIERISRTRSLQ
jgi:hypothetical protein